MASLSAASSRDDQSNSPVSHTSQSIFKALGKSGPITPVPVGVALQYWNAENQHTKEIDFPPQGIPGLDLTKDGKGNFDHGSITGSYEVNAEKDVRKCHSKAIGPGGSITYGGMKDVQRPPYTLGQTDHYQVKDGAGLAWTTFREAEPQSRSVLECNSRSLLVTGALLEDMGLEKPSTPKILGHGDVSLYRLPMDYSQASQVATITRHPRDAPLGELGVQMYQDTSGRDVIVRPTKAGTSGNVYNSDGTPAASWDDYFEKSADGSETPCTRSVWYGKEARPKLIQTTAWSKEGRAEMATDLGTF